MCDEIGNGGGEISLAEVVKNAFTLQRTERQNLGRSEPTTTTTTTSSLSARGGKINIHERTNCAVPAEPVPAVGS